MGRLLNGSLLAALLLALLGGGATYLALAGDPAVAAGDRGTVLVVARDLNVGALITAGDVREATAEANTTVFQGAATSADQVVGRYALLPMLAGELLIQAKVGAEPPGSGLAMLIPAGRVAVSVAVNDVIRTGGFIAPGDRVDVLGVVSQEATGSAELILRDIAVLAVSNAVVGDAAGEARTGADNPRSLDTTVTLAVTPDEARRLVQVDEVGKLRLALRPRASETTTD
jgi:pilus assembly protein CpaB